MYDPKSLFFSSKYVDLSLTPANFTRKFCMREFMFFAKNKFAHKISEMIYGLSANKYLRPLAINMCDIFLVKYADLSLKTDNFTRKFASKFISAKNNL